MNKSYQQESYPYGSFEQEHSLDPEESRQRREYRDLYDPFKSNWQAALGNADIRGTGYRKKDFPGAHENFSASTYRSRYGSYLGAPRHFKERGRSGIGFIPYDSNQGIRRDIPGKFGESSGRIYGESVSLGTGFSGTALQRGSTTGATIGRTERNEVEAAPDRNTYGYYTTGYGPRD